MYRTESRPSHTPRFRITKKILLLTNQTDPLSVLVIVLFLEKNSPISPITMLGFTALEVLRCPLLVIITHTKLYIINNDPMKSRKSYKYVIFGCSNVEKT